MFCGNCGSNLPDAARFCPTCGQAVLPSQSAAETMPSTAPEEPIVPPALDVGRNVYGNLANGGFAVNGLVKTDIGTYCFYKDKEGKKPGLRRLGPNEDDNFLFPVKDISNIMATERYVCFLIDSTIDMGQIVRLKHDSMTMESVLAAGKPSRFFLYNERIYYTKYTAKGAIYSTDLNGNGDRLEVGCSADEFFIHEDTIYFTDKADEGIWSVGLGGGTPICIFREHRCTHIQIDQQRIYCLKDKPKSGDRFSRGNVIFMGLDGSAPQVVCENAEAFNMQDGVLYIIQGKSLEIRRGTEIRRVQIESCVLPGLNVITPNAVVIDSLLSSTSAPKVYGFENF